MRALISLGAALLIGACAGTARPAGQEVVAGDAQNGQAVSARVGDTVRVTLSTTFWTFAPVSDPSVLQAEGEAVVSPAPRGSCFPGMGCGTTTASFKAVKAGSALVSATRLSCGEARRCVGAEGQYQVTVLVT